MDRNQPSGLQACGGLQVSSRLTRRSASVPLGEVCQERMDLIGVSQRVRGHGLPWDRRNDNGETVFSSFNNLQPFMSKLLQLVSKERSTQIAFLNPPIVLCLDWVFKLLLDFGKGALGKLECDVILFLNKNEIKSAFCT